MIQVRGRPEDPGSGPPKDSGTSPREILKIPVGQCQLSSPPENRGISHQDILKIRGSAIRS